MKVGKTLDRLVAEHVMGWVEAGAYWAVDTAADSVCPANSFHPSTDVADAWLVVDRMRELGYRLIFTDDIVGPMRTAMFVGSGHAYTGYAETDAGAICKAALRAFPVIALS